MNQQVTPSDALAPGERIVAGLRGLRELLDYVSDDTGLNLTVEQSLEIAKRLIKIAEQLTGETDGRAGL